MDFVSQLREVPITHSTLLRLQKLAKALQLPDEAAAGYAIEQYMEHDGERRIQVEAARLQVDKDRNRGKEPGAPTCPAKR